MHIQLELLYLALSRFDFILADGTHVKGNGYRSLLHALNSLLLQLHQILLKCTKERSSMFFLPGDHISNLTAYCRALEVYMYVYSYMYLYGPYYCHWGFPGRMHTSILFPTQTNLICCQDYV